VGGAAGVGAEFTRHQQRTMPTGQITTSQGDAIGNEGARKARLANVDWVRKAFESFDVDKSGYIDPQELRAALTMLGVNPSVDVLKAMGLEDKDKDGKLSLADVDHNGDNMIDFEEFKAMAALVPKRDHAIYRCALAQEKITLPKDTSRVSETMRLRAEAQNDNNTALNTVLAKLRTKMGLTKDSDLLKDTKLLRKFQELDASGDGRVDQKELEKYLLSETPELTKRDAWFIMSTADKNNDKHVTFDEFKTMMQTVAKGVLD